MTKEADPVQESGDGFSEMITGLRHEETNSGIQARERRTEKKKKKRDLDVHGSSEECAWHVQRMREEQRGERADTEGWKGRGKVGKFCRDRYRKPCRLGEGFGSYPQSNRKPLWNCMPGHPTSWLHLLQSSSLWRSYASLPTELRRDFRGLLWPMTCGRQ